MEGTRENRLAQLQAKKLEAEALEARDNELNEELKEHENAELVQ